MAMVLGQGSATTSASRAAADQRAADAETIAALASTRRGAIGRAPLWAMRLLPCPRREALYALCAFWHAIDDIVDDDMAPARKSQLLGDWRHQIGLLFDGRPQHAVTRALAGAVRACELRRDDFLAIIDGKLLQIETAVQAPSLIQLDVHCAQVAVAFGRLAVRILGLASPIADRAAAELGRGVRLTAILRDLDSDAAYQRLYLPRDVLRAHGIVETDPHAVLDHPALPWVCDVVAQRAERHFADAACLMARLPRRKIRVATVLLAVHRALLHAVVARGWHRIEQPVRVSPWRATGLMLRYAVTRR